MGLGYRGRFQPLLPEIGIYTHLPPVAKSVSLSLANPVSRVCSACARVCVSACAYANEHAIVKPKAVNVNKGC